jgi:hypothetical protein
MLAGALLVNSLICRWPVGLSKARRVGYFAAASDRLVRPDCCINLIAVPQKSFNREDPAVACIQYPAMTVVFILYKGVVAAVLILAVQRVHHSPNAARLKRYHFASP